jgi:uncharacterized protein YehS (DUF1456 family)
MAVALTDVIRKLYRGVPLAVNDIEFELQRQNVLITDASVELYLTKLENDGYIEIERFEDMLINVIPKQKLFQ